MRASSKHHRRDRIASNTSGSGACRATRKPGARRRPRQGAGRGGRARPRREVRDRGGRGSLGRLVARPRVLLVHRMRRGRDLGPFGVRLQLLRRSVRRSHDAGRCCQAVSRVTPFARHVVGAHAGPLRGSRPGRRSKRCMGTIEEDGAWRHSRSAKRNRSIERTPRAVRRWSSYTACGCCPAAGIAGQRSSRRRATPPCSRRQADPLPAHSTRLRLGIKYPNPNPDFCFPGPASLSVSTPRTPAPDEPRAYRRTASSRLLPPGEAQLRGLHRVAAAGRPLRASRAWPTKQLMQAGSGSS
jgi:hypothetical protein